MTKSRCICRLLFILHSLPFGTFQYSLAISFTGNAQPKTIQVFSNVRCHAMSGKTIGVSRRKTVLREGISNREEHHENSSHSNTFSRTEYESDLEEFEFDSGDEFNSDDVSEEELIVAVQMQTITDEEALLACRAYLQRKNKLSPSQSMPDGGWAQAKQRQRKLINSLSTMDSDDIGCGYFWEDPNELRYLRTGRPRMKFDAKGMEQGGQIDELSDADADFLSFDTQISGTSIERSNENLRDLDDEVKDSLILEEESEGGVFTGFPSFPPKSHTRRSMSKKALFRDPVWKEKWHSARWGDHIEREKIEQRKKAKKVDKLIEQIPSDILRSPELAALSDDEIEDAIKTYMLANSRRSKSQKERLSKRQMILQSLRRKRESGERDSKQIQNNEVKLPGENASKPSISGPTLDAFMKQNDELQKKALQKQQRKRSERATNAYQTRIRNLEKKQHLGNSQFTRETIERKCNVLSGCEKSMRADQIIEAMNRIISALNYSMKPELKDVELILEPIRLSKRKIILKDILYICFGLVGKCIPDLYLSGEDLKEYYSGASLTEVDQTKKKFITRSTVSELGEFILFMLRQQDTKLQ